MIRITATPVSLFVSNIRPRILADVLRTVVADSEGPIVHAQRIDAELRRRGEQVQLDITYTQPAAPAGN